MKIDAIDVRTICDLFAAILSTLWHIICSLLSAWRKFVSEILSSVIICLNYFYCHDKKNSSDMQITEK